MKKLFTLTVILYSLMFSTVSFGEWTEVGENLEGNTLYIDFERIRTHNDYRYVWTLLDNLEPTEFGILSTKVYRQVDCKESKTKYLQYVFYKQPMGEGSGESVTGNGDWIYPPPYGEDALLISGLCKK